MPFIPNHGPECELKHKITLALCALALALSGGCATQSKYDELQAGLDEKIHELVGMTETEAVRAATIAPHSVHDTSDGKTRFYSYNVFAEEALGCGVAGALGASAFSLFTLFWGTPLAVAWCAAAKDDKVVCRYQFEVNTETGKVVGTTPSECRKNDFAF